MGAGVQLAPLDWLAIVGYLALALFLGTILSRRASRSVGDFYLAGRSLPWWVAGTSMVATSFAADTPLVVTGWVRSPQGISQNWLWWGMAVGGALSFVVLASWWRRLEVTTDVEIVERRYAGRPARALRALYGGYHALITNTIILGWVLLAMLKIVRVVFGLESGQYDVLIVGGALVLALSYSILSGLWGVVMTDLFQFALALFGAIALLWVVVDDFGGLAAAREAIVRAAGERTRFFPAPGGGSWHAASFWTQGFCAFLVFTGVQGWINKNADGGGIAVQRFSACRSEAHARGAALWFHLAHYCLRPWPWILVALLSLAVPEIAGMQDGEAAYPAMMARFLGPGMFGLMCASFLAAFMSTLDTHFNLASAYVVNDLYRRFLRPGKSDRHYIWVGRGAEVVVGILAALFALAAKDIGEMFKLSLALLGGLGPAYLLRWFWWRANAWTEISALLSSTFTTVTLRFLVPAAAWPAAPFNGWKAGTPWDHAGQYLVIVLLSTAVMLVVTLRTRPVPLEHLQAFHDKVRPLGAWGPLRRPGGPGPAPGAGRAALLAWLGGVALIFGLLLGIGSWLLGRPWEGWMAAALGGGLLLALFWRKSCR